MHQALHIMSLRVNSVLLCLFLKIYLQGPLEFLEGMANISIFHSYQKSQESITNLSLGFSILL